MLGQELTLIDHPRTVKTMKSSTKGLLNLKVALFHGADNFIGDCAVKRQKDSACTQLPRKDRNLPKEYQVRVLYGVGEAGIFVQRIDVKIGDKFSCFFEADTKVGAKKWCDGHFHSYFLDNADCVIKEIEEYEDLEAVERLSKYGPAAFLEMEEIDDEPDEPDPPHDPDEEEDKI